VAIEYRWAGAETIDCRHWRHEAARVHHATRRGGCRLAAGGTRAAACDAGHWVPQQPVAARGRLCRGGVPPRPQGRRLQRRSERRNRVSLGRRSVRPPELAVDLVRRKVAPIASTGGIGATLRQKAVAAGRFQPGTVLPLLSTRKKTPTPRLSAQILADEILHRGERVFRIY
jgi:hypothetical protein